MRLQAAGSLYRSGWVPPTHTPPRTLGKPCPSAQALPLLPRTLPSTMDPAPPHPAPHHTPAPCQLGSGAGQRWVPMVTPFPGHKLVLPQSPCPTCSSRAPGVFAGAVSLAPPCILSCGAGASPPALSAPPLHGGFLCVPPHGSEPEPGWKGTRVEKTTSGEQQAESSLLKAAALQPRPRDLGVGGSATCHPAGRSRCKPCTGQTRKPSTP